MNFKFMLLSLIAVLLFTTCKKDDAEEDCSNPEPCPCTGDDCIDIMMDYTYFLPGTWWVYEEQNSGLRDSIYVYEAFEGENSEGLRFFVVRMHSEYDGYNYYNEFAETVSGVGITRPECQVQSLKRTKTKPEDFIGTGTVLFTPFILDDFRYDGGGGVLSIDSIWQDKNVIEEIYFDVDNCRSEHNEHTGLNFRLNIGIIKKYRFEQDQYWELVSYNIIQ